MKKVIIITVIMVLSLLSVKAYARSGDIAGVYYSTDIVTTLNGVEIDAINIGGQTLISAEDMHYYGFNVLWDPASRELRITSKKYADRGIPPEVTRNNQVSGTVLGNYYETDIITYLNNKTITSYNVGGRIYIHAEETRSHGFDAIWNKDDRTLTVVSPEFAGYEFTITMTQGKAQTKEGMGCFKLSYSPDKIAGFGDADYFSSVFNSYGNSYSVLIQFYQNEGLFFSSKLLETLRKYADNGTNAVGDIILSVNGKHANELTVSSYNGNGHNSFYIICNKGLRIREEDIKTVELSVGENIPDTAFEIQKYETSTSNAKRIFANIKKFPLDRLESYYEADEHFVLNVYESEMLGCITNRLYVVNIKQEISNDLLDQVRAIAGFNENKLNVYALRIGAVKTNLFFSCASSKKNGDFYVELETCKVHLISQRDR